MRKTPGWLKDYKMTEMSVCKEIRRPTSSIAEDVGVGGMLEDGHSRYSPERDAQPSEPVWTNRT